MSGIMCSPESPDLIFCPCSEEDLPLIVEASLALLSQVEREKGMDLSLLQQLLLRETLQELPDYTKVIRRGLLAGWYHLIQQSDHLELDDLNVLAPWRGQGLGSQVLQRVQAQARAAGLPLRCLVTRDNEAALRFYRRHGFRDVESPGDRYLLLAWGETPASPAK